MKEKIISGIQQVGIGVADVMEAMAWYNRIFGFDVKVFDDEGVAERMLPYTAGKPQPRRAVLMYNLRGGGGFEIWQPKERELNWPAQEISVGDLGIYACKIKSPDICASFSHLKASGVSILNEPIRNIEGKMHFYMRDPYGNLFDIEEDDFVAVPEKKAFGGVNGVLVGVSDMERSIAFYSSLLAYNRVVADRSGIFEDLKELPGGLGRMRRVVLRPSKAPEGPFSQLMGPSCIELIQSLDTQASKIFENRLWGDPGFIHLCFDIRNMECIRQEAEALGHPFVCDGGADFDMGDANGHFTYVEDPDGMLIEFVETFKVPILKKWGLYIRLAKRDDRKPLPFWLIKALRFMRVKL